VVLEPQPGSALTQKGPPAYPAPSLPSPAQCVDANTLHLWLSQASPRTLVLDFSPSANYVKSHIPGAWFVLRSDLARALRNLPAADRYVLTDSCTRLARHALPEVSTLTGKPTYLLEGSTPAWQKAGFPSDSGESHLASPRIDRYRRPYEGTDAPAQAMQAYLDWEFGLVAQLGRDGTHGFRVI